MKKVTTIVNKYYFEKNDALIFRIEMLRHNIKSYNELAKRINMDAYKISLIVRGVQPCTKDFFERLKKINMNFTFNIKKEEKEI